MPLGLSPFGVSLKNWDPLSAGSMGAMPSSPRTSFSDEEGLMSGQGGSPLGGAEAMGEDNPLSGEDWEGNLTPSKRKLSPLPGLTRLDAGHTVIKRNTGGSAEWEGSSPRLQGSPTALQSPQLKPRPVTPPPPSPSLSGGGGSQGLPAPPAQAVAFGSQPLGPRAFAGAPPPSAAATGAPPGGMIMRARHVAMDTRSVKERQRRVNVKEGMRQLQDLLPQRDVIMDKVTLLSKAVAYIKELQDKVKAYEAQASGTPKEPSSPSDNPRPQKSPSPPTDQ